MHARRLTAVATAALLVACSQSHSGAKSGAHAGGGPAVAEGESGDHAEAPPAGETAPAQNLPPGVVARAEGKQGVVQVEERNGLRILTIGGTVHGAISLDTAVAPLSGDPAVQLIRAARPKARTALVIGLGTGKTARELEQAGLSVEAVELEPAVVEFARKYFGYEGNAVVDDGIAFLEKKDKTWDVLLMDAASEVNPPPRLISEQAIGLMRRRTAAGGVTLLRKHGEPQDFVTKMIAGRLESTGGGRMPFVHVFGSGVGAEMQNLYFLASDEPLNLVDVKGLAVWPILLMDAAPPSGIPNAPDEATEQSGPERRVRLVGYLNLLPGDQALALDLPHWEMGAVRYLLSGPATDGLRAKLGKKPAFPTNGDIASDGDTSRTLKEVLGGGGVKRSDVRFSPVIIAVEGTARLRSVVHPNASSRMPPSMRGNAVEDDRLPYGGALYDLEVSDVLWTLDRARWKTIDRRLRPFVARAEKRIRAGALRRAAEELDGYQKVLDAEMLTMLPQHDEMKLLADEIARAAAGPKAEPGSFELAAKCDRTAEYMKSYELVSVDVVSVRNALRGCARASYERVARRPDAPHAAQAAGRLLDIYERLGYGDDPKAERTYTRKREALAEKFPGVQPAKTPPNEEPPR